MVRLGLHEILQPLYYFKTFFFFLGGAAWVKEGRRAVARACSLIDLVVEPNLAVTEYIVRVWTVWTWQIVGLYLKLAQHHNAPGDLCTKETVDITIHNMNKLLLSWLREVFQLF